MSELGPYALSDQGRQNRSLYWSGPDVSLVVAAPRPILRQSSYGRTGKRLFDIAFVIAALPFAIPLIAVLALLVMLDGANPFFAHKRAGQGGRMFGCLKLRSMVPDAEQRLRDHLANSAEAREEWETTFKLNDDPRITRLGCFLRKSSLDELPQLWNILRGEMSVVGPRPVTEPELKMYGSFLPVYQAMRPGLTGLWQVSGRNNVSYEDRVAMDMTYARNHSLAMDCKIVLGTLRAVLKKTGR